MPRSSLAALLDVPTVKRPRKNITVLSKIRSRP
jgi:hypothetical protein